MVTTNLIIAETHTLLLRRTSRQVALTFVREVQRSPNIVISSSPDYEQMAVTDWLDKFDDQDFSFTDAVSFAVMSDLGIRDVLAAAIILGLTTRRSTCIESHLLASRS